jgi:hypothetical protein
LAKARLYILLKGSEGNLHSNINIYIAAYRNKEVAIASGNYERTREEKEASTIY